MTLSGREMESRTELTHRIPEAPGDVAVNGEAATPEDGAECEEEDLAELSGPVTLAWDAVTESHPELGVTGAEVDVIRYQAVAEWEDDDENVFKSEIDLQPDDDTQRYSVTFPSEFFATGSEVKFEVLARESSFNQTAVETCPFEFVAD